MVLSLAAATTCRFFLFLDPAFPHAQGTNLSRDRTLGSGTKPQPGERSKGAWGFQLGELHLAGIELAWNPTALRPLHPT